MKLILDPLKIIYYYSSLKIKIGILYKKSVQK
jgi:hypothetical protein